MTKPIAFTVSVNYWDYLETTLPRMAEWYDTVWVITHPADRRSILVANATAYHHKNIGVYQSPAFYARNADFNKGAAIEQCFRSLEPQGWIVVQDADILLPRRPQDLPGEAKPGCIYGPTRRQATAGVIWDEEDWSKLPPGPDKVTYCPGFWQMFHTEDKVLRGKFPWYPTNWRHAGGADSDFCEKWPRRRQKRLPFEVLHLGTPQKNWCGRTTPYLGDCRPPDGAKLRQKRLTEMLAQRRRRGNLKAEKL